MDDLDEEFVEIIAAVGPRRRGQIVAAVRALAGDIRADADQLGTAAIHAPDRTRLKVLGLLPQQTFGQSRFWRYQLAAAAEALAGDTDRWGAPVPRCTGEEMVLHLTLHRAAAAAGCPPQEVFAWPEDPTCDHGWGDLFEYLFQDHDVLMLYDVPEYGLSDLGTVNIEPHQWLQSSHSPTPFRNDTSRNREKTEVPEDSELILSLSAEETQNTPLRELVAGFGEIAAVPIPYARLPRRLGAYAQEFPRWSDVAGQTPQALHSLPKVGDGAVRALVQAAQEAVKTHRDAVAAGGGRG